jgi:hypothetical protein
VVLVPLVKDAVRHVTPAQRRIEVNLDFLGLSGADDAQMEQGEQGPRGSSDAGAGA